MPATWASQALLAIVHLVPAWLGIPFYKKNFEVSAMTYAGWYFLGTAVTILIISGLFGRSPSPQVSVVGSIFFIGLIAGGIANGLLFSAVANAPNPGMAVAMGNVTSMVVFLASLALAHLAPKYFPMVEADWRAAIGIVLVVIGAACIVIR